MARKLTVLTTMLLTMVVPALAQEEKTPASGQYAGEEISVTGVVENLGSSTLPPYGLRDEATGGVYYLEGDVDFGALEGDRITAYGTPEEVIRSVVLNVTRVEPADGPPGPPPGEETATLTFELAVEGTPPADATFFGNLQTGEGGPGSFVPLEDPDGDGLYTGSTTAARFGPGLRPVPSGVEPLSFGVRIVQGTGTQGSRPGEPITAIRDFGAVQMNDQTFAASVSFDEDATPDPPPGEFATFSFELTVECEPPADAEFLGFTSSESLVTTPLTDPDGDGLYTGSITQPRFPPGPRPVPPNVEPVSLPVRIVQGPPTGSTGLGPEFRVIKDFGLVTAKDETFAASVSFCNDGGSGDDSGSGDDGSGDGGGSVSGGSDNGGSGGGVTESIRGILPSTGGGMALTVLGAGVLLIGGGLLVRRIFR